MSVRSLFKLFVVLAIAVPLASSQAALAAEARISGRVMNGTTGSPVAGQALQLLMPRGGMQPVATALTDATGHYAIASSQLAIDSFYLLQAVFQGANYHAPVKFDENGSAQADLTVYDSTPSEPPLKIQSARIVLRAEGDKIDVQEMFEMRNSSDPPRTYVNPAGTFPFHLASPAAEPSAAAVGLMNMPLPQPVSHGKNPGDFYLQYPLKPGMTVMMVAYQADYSSGKFDLNDSVAYPIDSVDILVSPSSLSLTSSLFKAFGVDVETKSEKYWAENVPAHTGLAVSVSGESAQVSGRESPAGPTDADVKSLPNSMTRMGVPALACFLLILLWGLGVRVAKELSRWKAEQGVSEAHRALEAEAENMFNSIADLDVLFAAGKIAEKPYWKERLELKARLVATLKKAPPALLESYALRHTPR